MGFSQQLSRFHRETMAVISDIRRMAILRLFRDIVMDTPVEEGTLRGNWQVNSVSPLLGPLSDRTLEEVFSEMEAVLSGSSLEDTIFLNNNLPYAYPIEFLGWSRIKAPQGMVRKNIIRWDRIVLDAVKKRARV